MRDRLLRNSRLWINTLSEYETRREMCLAREREVLVCRTLRELFRLCNPVRPRRLPDTGPHPGVFTVAVFGMCAAPKIVLDGGKQGEVRLRMVGNPVSGGASVPRFLSDGSRREPEPSPGLKAIARLDRGFAAGMLGRTPHNPGLVQTHSQEEVHYGRAKTRMATEGNL
jgi:hypothetical protein